MNLASVRFTRRVFRSCRAFPAGGAGGYAASVDLFATARTNDRDLLARMATITGALSNNDRDAANRFAARVGHEGRISINMRPSVLLSFLVSSRHQNIYEWAAARAFRSSKTAPEIMREQLGPYYERRMAFDGFFLGGDKLRYGALNIGGLGASHYGSYCGWRSYERTADRCSGLQGWVGLREGR